MAHYLYYQGVFCVLLCLAALHRVHSSALVSMTRGINPTKNATCTFPGGKLVVGMPLSLSLDAKFAQFGQIQFAAQSIVTDYINQERCGINVGLGLNRSLELRYYDDLSSKETTAQIAQNLVNDPNVDLIMAGYSSGLTNPLSKATDEHRRLMIAGGSSNTPVYKNRNMSFGLLPLSGTYLLSALDAVISLGAESVAVVNANSSNFGGSCMNVARDASLRGLNTTSLNLLPMDSPLEEYEKVALKLKGEDPDVVFTCTYNCERWVKAMRNSGWSPKANIFIICVGTPEFQQKVGTDAEYMIGASAWHSTLRQTDPVTGWSSQEFADFFYKESSHDYITYHAAAFASTISVLVQAIEQTQSIDDAVLAEYIARSTFQTAMGGVSFDENGQNSIPMLLIQYQTNNTIQTVYPEEARSSPMVYPMPNWNERDCMHLAICGKESTMEECGPNGRCLCSDPHYSVSVGQGATAACNPAENKNYIPKSLKYLGYTAFTLTIAAIGLAAVWTWNNRYSWTVKAAQPSLLGLILLGCLLSNLAIPFMGVETGYPWVITSGDDVYPPETSENPDISRVNTACMATPWLYGVGFAVTFSALFVKIERVRRISAANKSKEASTTKLGFLRFVYIGAAVLALELIILISWQVASPFQWEREVLWEQNEFAIESVGRCASDHGTYFLLAMVILHMALLLAALILSFQTRHIDEDFAESNSLAMIVAFMFQVMLLAIPIALMVNESNDIYYIVKVGVVALQNFTVLGLIFVPKVMKNAKAKDGERPQSDTKETIPLASLTNSKWDEGVDLINELLKNPDLTEDQKTRLSGLLKLVLQGNTKKSKKEEKMSYLPKNLLLTRAPAASRFVMEEYGGVDLSDDSSVATSLTAFSGHMRSSTIDVFSETDSGLDTPSEFLNLDPKAQARIKELLSLPSLEVWGFNIFELAEVSGGHPLLFMGWAILGSPHSQRAMAKSCGQKFEFSPNGFQGYFFTDAKRGFNIPVSTLCSYLRAIESDYNADNPYHNAIHAADVVQSLHALLRMMDASCSNAGVRPNLRREHLFAVLLGAAVHDVKHPGRSNAFQVHAKTGYALTYNNESVLENMHVSHAFRRMLDLDDGMVDESDPIKVQESSSLNVLATMTQKEYDSVRSKMIEAILHTDMSKHFEGVANMKSLTLPSENGGEAVAEQAPGPALFKTEENTWQLLMFMMHLADISGQAKPDSIFQKWTTRVMDEFFEQGDQEASLGMAISPLCDRKATKVADSQVGFIRFVIQPAFEVCGQLLPEVQKRIVPQVEQNLRYWEQQKSLDGTD